MKRRVLVVEDEEAIRDFIVINLQRSGYEVTDVSTGEEALRVFRTDTERFDLVILDIMLPGIDGFQVCKQLRDESDTVGLIFLSARTQEQDKIDGLMMGADDYMTKPFSLSELMARVEAVYRRVKLMQARPRLSTIESGPFILDIRGRTLYKNNQPIDLTQVEYHIIELLIRNHGQPMERARILEQVWSDQIDSESRLLDAKIVDVNIRRLRVKIEDNPSEPQYIQTIWGYGYKWCP